ncbi:MAG: hypothetical protein ACE5IK_12390 [Acidobacteriota bacterium]
MRKSLDEFLEASGLFSGDQINDAHRTQQFFGGSVLSNMVRLGYVTEPHAGELFSKWSGYPYIAYRELKNRRIPLAVIRFMRREDATRRKVVPFMLADGELHVVTCRGDNEIFFDEMSRRLGFTVVPHITPDERLDILLERHYGVPMAHRETVKPIPDQHALTPVEPETVDPTVADDTTGLPPDIGLDGLPLDSDVTVPRFMENAVLGDLDDAGGPTPATVRAGPSDGPTPRTTSEAERPPLSDPRITSPMTPVARAQPAPAPSITTPDAGPVVAEDIPPAPGESTSPPSPPTTAASSAAGLTPPAAMTAADTTSFPAGATEALAILAGATDRDAVGRAAVDLVRSMGAPRVALLTHRHQRLVGWYAAGDGVDLQRFSRLSVPLYTPSVFAALRVKTTPYLGVLADQPANNELLAGLGGTAGQMAVVAPILLKGRIVGALYADGGLEKGPVLEVDRLHAAAAKLALALEILLLRNKIRH